MDHDASNAASRERLRRLIASATDDDLRRTVDEGWTAAGTLAHIAFWDRVTHARWKAILGGQRIENTIFPSDGIHWTNEAGLPQWNALPPRAAAEDALHAAEELDGLINGLPAWAIEHAKAQGRPGMLDRDRHRGQHLERIAEGLGRPAPAA